MKTEGLLLQASKVNVQLVLPRIVYRFTMRGKVKAAFCKPYKCIVGFSQNCVQTSTNSLTGEGSTKCPSLPRQVYCWLFLKRYTYLVELCHQSRQHQDKYNCFFLELCTDLPFAVTSLQMVFDNIWYQIRAFSCRVELHFLCPNIENR